MPKNIILTSLKESFTQIFKNKSLFLLLIILQIIFFIFLSLISSIYIPKIQQNAKLMYDYLNQQKLDEISVTQNILQQKNILGDDPLSLSRYFSEIIKNFRIYLAYIFILSVVFISAIWAASHKLIHKHSYQKSLNNFSKIFIIVFFYLGLMFLFFFSLLNISFTEAALNMTMVLGKYLLFFFASIILLYFMFISISLADKIELRDIVQKTLGIGIRKIHYLLTIYCINIFFILISLILLFYFSETNFLIVFLAIILFVFSFLLGRIFILNVVEKLE